MNDPFAEIKRRHADIPQDTLPLDFGDAEHEGEPTKRSTAKSMRFAMCPHCAKTTMTGVVRASDGREVFRDHNMILTGGRRIRCRGSGRTATRETT